jgi:nucleoside-diphosphate-sugar epimerase
MAPLTAVSRTGRHALAAQCRDGIEETLNVASRQCSYPHDLTNLLFQEILGMELRLLHTRDRPGDVRHTLADISKAKRCLDYRPHISFEEGIIRTACYFTDERQGTLKRIT